MGKECGDEMLDTEGGFFGGFDDDRVSCCEGWSEFFDCYQEGVVPGSD